MRGSCVCNTASSITVGNRVINLINIQFIMFHVKHRKGLRMYLLYYLDGDDVINVGFCASLNEAMKISADYYDTRSIVLKTQYLDVVCSQLGDCYRVVTVYSSLNKPKFSYYTECYTRNFSRVEYPIIDAGHVRFVFNMIVSKSCTDKTIENTANRVFKSMAKRYVSGFYDFRGDSI